MTTTGYKRSACTKPGTTQLRVECPYPPRVRPLAANPSYGMNQAHCLHNYRQVHPRYASALGPTRRAPHAVAIARPAAGNSEGAPRPHHPCKSCSRCATHSSRGWLKAEEKIVGVVHALHPGEEENLWAELREASSVGPNAADGQHPEPPAEDVD